MYRLSSIAIVLLVSIVECSVLPQQDETTSQFLDCSKFKRDLDVIRSFSFVVQMNPLIKTNKTYAIMNSNSQIEELNIFHEVQLPIDVFCLVSLHTLQVNGTPFVHKNEFGNYVKLTGVSPLISRLNKLTILSLVNTTASYIPEHALAVLTNLTKLQVEGCDLYQIPSSLSLLTKLEELNLAHNHLDSMPDVTTLQQLSELVSINLSHNKIRDIIDLAEISSRNVLTMDFSYNQIDYIPPEISQFYYQLTRLYLNDNQLAYIPTDIFKLVYLTQANFERNLLPADEITAIKARFRSVVPLCTLKI